MSDIKSMLAKMASNGTANGEGQPAPGPAPKPKSNKKQTIEETYQKKSQLEHILLRPDTYIGSVEKAHESMWVYDETQERMTQKQITYVPGLYKIFDEILVNAADNKQRDNKMDCIKITIDQETNTISVWNNGQGIPVAMHKEENIYVPTLIFGHLLTSSNYNDEEEKVTGGRNGYGAKLCNIFSTKFVVETASREYKRAFKQTWSNNMDNAGNPNIKEYFGDDYTKVTFCPDLAKFKMDRLDDDIVQLMSRRAYDVAASTRGVKVFLNGKRLGVKCFKDYIELFVKGKEDDTGGPLKVVYEQAHERWEVAMTLSDHGFQQVSFVNSIATTKGGRHVDYVVDMIVKQLLEVLKKKNKGGVNIKPFQVKHHMWVFVNCLIVNPTFDSQTKENMTLQVKSFGSKCVLTEKFITQVVKIGIVESVLNWAKHKAQNELNKVGGKKAQKLKGIPKLEDANEAGSRNALKCTLILTEGDSAKSLAVSGLGVIGRDHYGVFPLKGKLLNVREATHKQILENVEINNLIKIVGLQYKKKYNTDEDMKSLRYGKVMIMTDQDQDGSHIKGLLINFIHYNWPELLQRRFLEEFITPIVKATKKKEELSFYSLPEFEEWKSNTANHKTYNIKYYKGLGTSTSKEAREYFSNMERHRIPFVYKGQQDDDHIVLAFSKKHIEHRKEWLTNFMQESKRRKELGLPENYLYTKTTRSVCYTDFINLELILFSNMDNTRSIPSVVDGLKPGQRKVMFTCFKRNDKKEVKVAQLAGSVAEMSAYHHGEVSLAMTIVNLAQNFVGSNNINLLEPRGQFGTRLCGGKDSASPRYIHTKMSPLTRLIFNPKDDALLKHEYEDNQKIEPVWYIPIIPMILVNGADGIGTGWMTKIPNFNPRQIVKNIRRMLDDEEPENMLPWYKNFKGSIEDVGDNRLITNGEISLIGHDKLEITELPVGVWTQNYKENILEPLLHGSEKVKSQITDYKEYNTDTTIRFVVSVSPSEIENVEKEGHHKVFKLQSTFSTSSMVCFDYLGCLRRYDSVLDMLKDFYTLRLEYYQKRKDYLEGILKAESDKLSNQARFITEKCNGTIVVENKKRKVIVDELIKRGYQADPVQIWKSKNEQEEEGESEEPEEQEDDETASSSQKKPVDPEKAFARLSDVKKFDYLLGMSMWMLTDEKKNELLRQRDHKLSELETLRRKTKSDLWREDLDEFMEKLDEVEEKERKAELNDSAKEKKKLGKKRHLQETMPSPVAHRIVPVIGEDLKKKLQYAAKTKENKLKKESKKKEISLEGEVDEFDKMVKSTKGLKERLSSSMETKKGKGKGLKQTKLNFNVKKGKGKKDNSDTEDSDNCIITATDSESPVKERVMARRAVAKPVRYKDAYDSGNSDANGAAFSSDSEDFAPPPRHETSEDMFDSLVGRKKDDKVENSAVNLDTSEETANGKDDAIIEDESPVVKKAAPKKRKPIVDLDSDSDNFVMDKPKKKPAATKGRKKKKGSDDDDDDNVPKKTKAKKKKVTTSDDDDDDETGFNSDVPVRAKPGRNVKKPKYVIDDSDMSD